jgi:hypothetical protein
MFKLFVQISMYAETRSIFITKVRVSIEQYECDACLASIYQFFCNLTLSQILNPTTFWKNTWTKATDFCFRKLDRMLQISILMSKAPK